MEKLTRYVRKFEEELSEARPNFNWHLPSKEVLNEMIIHNSKTDSTGKRVSLSNGVYWSSSEVNTDLAWSQIVYDGEQFESNKKVERKVRAVKAVSKNKNYDFIYKGVAYQVNSGDAPKELNWNDAIKYCKNIKDLKILNI